MRPLPAEILILLGVALIPALASGWMQWEEVNPQGVPGTSGATLRPGEVLADDVAAWGEIVFWIDARARSQFEKGHIPGAVLLNEDEWEKLLPAMLEAWSPDRRIVVYCDGRLCEASHAVARRLREEVGIEDVHVLHGGWSAWSQNR